MKKIKNRVLILVLLFLLNLSIFGLHNSFDKISTDFIDRFSLNLSDPGKSLLHTYDFEDDIPGQDPTGNTLIVVESASTGTVNIDNLGDEQQNHVKLNKTGGTVPVRLYDNFSFYGQDFKEGELHFKFSHDNSIYGIHFRNSTGNVFLVDLWDGHIGHWGAPQTIYASYTTHQWTNLTIFYNISLGWMFEIDGVRYGDGYSYPFENGGSYGGPSGLTEVRWQSAFSASDGYLRLDDIAFYYETDNVINIFTPESKEYNKGMDGYYPATYGFEDAQSETLPSYCYYTAWGTTPDYTNSYTKVIDEKTDSAGNSHKNVLVLNDRSSSGCCGANLNFTKHASEIARNCTIEFYFYIRTEGASYYVSHFEINGNNGRLCQFALDNTQGGLNDPEIKYWNTTGSYHTGVYQEWNKWYRYSIDISCDGGYLGLGANQYRFRVYNDTGDLIYTSIDMGFENLYPLTGGPNKFRMSSSETQTLVYEYLDAFSITGLQDKYLIGDNVHEGLLLSFENSTALDWIGYSLDGQDNKSILGNTTIPMPEDGIHTIQVFGNDTLGNMHQSDVRYFTVDFPIDIITPEAKTYTNPMDGYYPATYGFEYDQNDDSPKGWVENSGLNGYAKVIGGIGGHNKVLECYSSSSGDSRIDTSIFFAPQEYGSFEFWWYKSSSYTSAAIVDFWGESTNCSISIRVDHWPSENNEKVEYQTGASGYLDTGYTYYSDNKWMHFRIDFNCNSDTYSLWIDQVKYLDNIDFIWSNDETGINQMRFDSYNTANAVLYYVDAVSFSWDSNYDIGDNLYEGLLLSFENSTILDWIGYSLDHQSVKAIWGNNTFSMPENGLHSIQVFGNDSLGIIYHSAIRYFTVNLEYINIITPENITYTEPMSGYYPATYGFENDEIGTFPEAWSQILPSGGSCEILESLDNHKNIINLTDTVLSEQIGILNNLSNREDGTIDLYYLTEDSNKRNIFTLYETDSTDGIYLRVDSGYLTYRTDAYYNIIPILNNRWYHISIKFNSTIDKFWITINGTIFGGSSGYDYRASNANMRHFQITSSIYHEDYSFYIDAIGYSWDPNYNIGDNMNEGLLLSYKSNIDLNWIGYSLDGQNNKTILGNTTIPMPDDGIHSIQVFGNESLGVIYQSSIKYFTVNTTLYLDIIPPNITINTPLSNELFGNIAPNFDITINDTDLSIIWYTLDAGLTNITTELTGKIDQTSWNGRPDGTVNIRFYANDTVGNIGSAVVAVRKDTTIPIITIIFPTPERVFRNRAPNFEITIVEDNLDDIWYTLDKGIINFSCETSGQINQELWDALEPKRYTLRFYANDLLGNEGYADVVIKKEEFEISGYDIFILSSILLIGIASFAFKMKKKN